MKITVQITDIGTADEQHDALLAVVEQANEGIAAENERRARLTPPQAALPAHTPASYLTALLDRVVNDYAKQSYNLALSRLGKAAAGLSYPDRLALIAEVERQLS